MMLLFKLIHLDVRETVLVFGFVLALALRRKKTFSAVGLGHDKIPFLSTQQRA